MLIVLILKVDIRKIFLLDESLAETFDGLPELESSFLEDTKIVLVYIAGFITRNHSGSSEEKLLNEAFQLFTNKSMDNGMDRDGLNIP